MSRKPHFHSNAAHIKQAQARAPVSPEIIVSQTKQISSTDCIVSPQQHKSIHAQVHSLPCPFPTHSKPIHLFRSYSGGGGRSPGGGGPPPSPGIKCGMTGGGGGLAYGSPPSGGGGYPG
mmetsp:Transcript_3893/g.8126  ORF Transcript_3893/g.8126 Transcript_3893/m.8126 type:complete len:119 (-) Transcript_3893:1625-1981(-)